MTPQERLQTADKIDALGKAVSTAIDNLWAKPGQEYVQLTESTARTIRDVLREVAILFRREAVEAEHTHITWNAQGQRMVNGQLGPEHREPVNPLPSRLPGGIDQPEDLDE